MSDQEPTNLDIITPPTEPPGPPSFWQRYQKPLWIGLVVLAAGVSALLAYLLFYRGGKTPQPAKAEVKLDIRAPSEIRSGSEITYEVVVTNLSAAKLALVNLEIFYPPGFTFLDSTPDPAGANQPGVSPRQFDFQDLGPFGEKILVIVGGLEGNAQEVATLSAKVHYIPENFRTSFSVSSEGSTEILPPELTVTLSAPPHVVIGQTITYSIDIANLTERAFSNLKLQLKYPEKFVPSSDGVEFRVDNLLPGQTRQISFAGKMFEVPDKELTVEAVLLLNDSQIARASAFTQVRPSPVVLEHKIMNPPASIVPGQELRYQVNYENSGDVGLSNVAVSVYLDSAVFDAAEARPEKGQITSASGKSAAVWIPATATELASLAPQKKGSFQLIVPISDKLVAQKQKNPVARTHAEFSAKELPEPIAFAALEYKIQTEVQLGAKATAVGGTAYQIDLEVANGVNDLAEAQLVATVPRAETEFLADSVKPADEKDRIRFVPVAGQIVWQLNEVFAFSGSFHDSRKISFQISLTPAAGENPANLLLLQGIEVAGTDKFTGQRVLSNKIIELRLGD